MLKWNPRSHCRGDGPVHLHPHRSATVPQPTCLACALLTFLPVLPEFSLRQRRIRRGDRAAECAGLENRCTRKGTGGSNPPLSAHQLRSHLRNSFQVNQFRNRQIFPRFRGLDLSRDHKCSVVAGKCQLDRQPFRQPFFFDRSSLPGRFLSPAAPAGFPQLQGMTESAGASRPRFAGRKSQRDSTGLSRVPRSSAWPASASPSGKLRTVPADSGTYVSGCGSPQTAPQSLHTAGSLNAPALCVRLLLQPVQSMLPGLPADPA